MIKVALENPMPEGVKVSRKNTVLISITPDHTEDDNEASKANEHSGRWRILNQHNVLIHPSLRGIFIPREIDDVGEIFTP